MNQIKIISFNGNGLNSAVRRQRALVWSKKHNVDILMLQETHSDPDDEIVWRNEWGGDIYMSHWKTNSGGVAILIAPHIQYDLISEFTDPDGRVVIIELSINERRFTLCNSYAYNEDKPLFFNSIMEKLASLNYENLIWGGDHNVVLNLDLDKKGGLYKTHEDCKNIINAWKEEAEVDDVWRIQHPRLLRFTWRSSKKPLIQTRLDYFLTSRNITTRVKFSDIIPGFSSDHSAPVICIDIKKANSGKGFWKLNTNLLKDHAYNDKILKCIVETIEENPGTDEILLWDTIKCRIRGTSVKYSAECKRKRINTLVNLETLLGKAKENLELYPVDIFPHIHAVLNNKIAIIKSKIFDYIDKETQGYILRSKTSYYEEGEKNSKYFLALEKIRGDSKSIKTLILDDGSSINDPDLILEEEKSFYSKLYSTTRNENSDHEELISKFIDSLQIPKLNEKDIEFISRSITEEELYHAISLSADNKSPGTDGIGNEFYKHFWSNIKDHLMKAINKSLSTGSLSISQRQGIISLIPKVGKNNNYLKNWRPISLLNQDYKLIARILAERCKIHLSKLVSDDQNGFVPGRYIGLNIHRILNLIEICKNNNINGILLNIDFEKAFDCIEWDFVYSALRAFGFPNIFINWVKILYNNISSCVINNGKFTCFFELQRGVRQGCPLSPYLFVLSAEILSLYIKQKGNIEGILHGNHNYLISQFADDTSLSIIANSDNIKRCFQVLKDFERVSGLRVNVTKTEAMGLGTFDKPICPELKIQWVEKTTRVLGIQIAKDKSILLAENFGVILDKIQARLNGWKRRKLSIMGKINIIKCLGISQVIFLLTMLPSPNPELLKNLERILYEFIWNGKADRIRRTTLIGDLDLGGINMINISSLNKALKISWVKRLCLQPGTWCSLITETLLLKPSKQNTVQDNIRYFLKSNLHFKDLNGCVKLDCSSLWYEILLEWCKFNYKPMEEFYSVTDILHQNVWFNSCIKVASCPVIYTLWYNAGIKYIHNLVHHNRWKSILEIEQEFGLKIILLDYLGILNSIPLNWRKLIKSNVEKYIIDDSYVANIDRLCKLDKVNKTIYKELVEKISKEPTDRWLKWMEELGEDVSELDWLDSFPRIHKCTTSTRLRSLGYRFLIRDVLTNTRLIHMGKAETVNCYLCNTEPETITHLYWNCQSTRRLWERLKLFILETMDILLELDPLVLLLGITRTRSDEGPPDIIYLLALIVKSYIHYCKCKKIFPTEIGLISKIKYIKNIELSIAVKNGLRAELNHRRKWFSMGNPQTW